jgi:hypothetical protein
VSFASMTPVGNLALGATDQPFLAVDVVESFLDRRLRSDAACVSVRTSGQHDA